MTFWNKLQGGGDIQTMMKEEIKKANEFTNKLALSTTSESFLGSRAAGIDSVCTYGRLAAMSVYSGLNIAVHTFGIVTQVVCACLSVYSETTCIIKKIPLLMSVCEPVKGVYDDLLGASTGAWNAVKASTAKCNSFGDARVQI